jgi:cobalt/nickel transport system permease protein
MHIPDGVLDPVISLTTYVVALLFLVVVLRYIGRELDSGKVSILSAFTAAIFVAQMISWPIPGGTSLHLVGSGLAGALLGPLYGFISLSVILFIQCIFFGDGGITALGANILNMGIIGVLSGYLVYRYARQVFRRFGWGSFLGGFLAGWISLILAGFACGVEIGVSSYFGFNLDITVPVMVGWHLVLGVVEGLITGFIIQYLSQRDIYGLYVFGPSSFSVRSSVYILILLLLILSPFFSIYLSNILGYREPLDIVLEALGYSDISYGSLWHPFKDYTVSNLPVVIGYIISGFIGIFIILMMYRLVMYGVGRLNWGYR